MRHFIAVCAALSFGLSISTPNIQAAPSVAVDIAPLHSLTSQVMDGVGQPKLLIPAGASPHYYNLKPSEAKALYDADVVFWIGQSYTPWLEKPLDNTAESTKIVEMLNVKGTVLYKFREGATFESHDHDSDDDHHDETHHKDEHHDEHKEHAHHNEHHHEGNDPHAWLDPENAKRWITHINDVLSTIDPNNAPTYHRNAIKAKASLDTLIHSTRTTINALDKPRFIVFHDAYQYFEKRFDIPATGSISLGDAEDPSPARLKKIRQTVKALNVTCIFTEPQYNPGLVKNVFENTTISTIGVMDPLGSNIPIGNNLYQQLINSMTASLEQCQ